MNRSIIAVSVAAVCFFGARMAAAQDTSTVGGSVGGSVSTGGDANATSTLPKPTPPAAAAPAAAAAANEASDHEQVVGRFAVGYLGASQVPLGPTLATITAPFVGVRYWMNEKIGLDLGLGLRTQSGSSENVNGGVTVTQEQPGVLAGGVKAGVPIALAYGKHFTFTIVPELLVAGATRTIKTQNQPDTSVTGARIELGARAGAEIQFGFIGVPQLALQGSVGLNFARIAGKQSTDTPQGTNSQASDALAFGTTVQSDPWALFTNNISALYYF